MWICVYAEITCGYAYICVHNTHGMHVCVCTLNRKINPVPSKSHHRSILSLNPTFYMIGTLLLTKVPNQPMISGYLISAYIKHY